MKTWAKSIFSKRDIEQGQLGKDRTFQYLTRFENYMV